MDFDKKKEAVLKKMASDDRSKKGGIDEDIRELLNTINSHNDYCTTSSCSGRIVLLDLRARLKSDNVWLMSKHAAITKEEFDTAMSEEKRGIVWLKQEPMILHIMCRDIQAAKKFIFICQEAGFKQIGLISVPRNIVEVMGSEMMSVPVYSEKLLIDETYRDFLIEEANRKLLVAKEKIAVMQKLVSKI